MSSYFTSDTHFGHAKIIEYCKRPFASVEEMDEELIKRWNERVGPDDHVYHLGDFAFGTKAKITEYRKRLNGHDHAHASGTMIAVVKAMRDCGFENVAEDADHTPSGLARTSRMSSTSSCVTCRSLDEESWKHVHALLTRFHFCGHVHEKWKRKGDVINVGVDQWDFRPVTLPELLMAEEG
jgi:calcineurin-like phosphoesterase family protein